MINFTLEAHERDMLDEFRFVARELLRPFAVEADRIEDLPETLLCRPEIVELMRGFVPKEFGGGWRSLLEPDRCYDIEHTARMRVIACEEGGWGDPALFISLPGPGLAYPALRAHGSPAQQKRFFEPFRGNVPKWAAFAMTEPKAGSDVAAISTTARKEKDHYILNGRKWFVGSGARADWTVVFATVDQTRGQFGIRSFIVERDTPGFRVGRILPSMGMKALQLAELVFEDCKVSEENLLGQHQGRLKGGGFQAGVQTFNMVRPGIAAIAVGIARAAGEHVEEIVERNGAKHVFAHKWREAGERIKRMKRRTEAARLLCWSAASLADQQKDNSREVSVAKAFGAKVAMEVCTESMDIAARSGFDDLGTLDRLFRNAKVFDILEGTGEVQRLMITKSLIRANSNGMRGTVSGKTIPEELNNA